VLMYKPSEVSPKIEQTFPAIEPSLQSVTVQSIPKNRPYTTVIFPLCPIVRTTASLTLFP